MGWSKIKKTLISWERNITFLQNKKILNLCLRWHILRSYRFIVEVNVKNKEKQKQVFETTSISMHLMLEKIPENDHNNVSLFMWVLIFHCLYEKYLKFFPSGNSSFHQRYTFTSLKLSFLLQIDAVCFRMIYILNHPWQMHL